MIKEDAVATRLVKRSLLRIFTMSFSAPAFLVAPACEMRVLRHGETVRHAWGRVGMHMTSSMGRLTGEPRTEARDG